MSAKKFELFMGCLGNGITVCNKAVIEHGDYKTIAHISNAGNIKFYVNESYIPESDMEKIKKAAEHNRETFRKNFEMLSDIQQYGKIIDELPIKKFVENHKDNRTLEEKLPELREYYYFIM